jgi:large subunit ribosomal protein L17
MRHGKKINHLSRKSAHRKAMLANMAASLILHKRIETTVAKAKALRTYIEPLITRSKDDTTHSRRIIFSHLQSKEAVTELFRDVSVKVADRPGGYTRIIKIGNRLGDNADMCMMELVDFNENLLGDKQGKAKTTRKRRGTGKKKVEETVATAAVAAKTEDSVQEPTDEKVSEVKTAGQEVSDEDSVQADSGLKAEADNPVEEENTDNTKEESK